MYFLIWFRVKAPYILYLTVRDQNGRFASAIRNTSLLFLGAWHGTVNTLYLNVKELTRHWDEIWFLPVANQVSYLQLSSIGDIICRIRCTINSCFIWYEYVYVNISIVKIKYSCTIVTACIKLDENCEKESKMTSSWRIRK